MEKQPKLFFDYGEMLFNYDFNRDTLLRAHKLVLNHLDSRGQNVSLDQLSDAHNQAIQSYLTARNKNFMEWSMEKIMGLMFRNLGIDKNAPINEVSHIYKLNDHDARPMPGLAGAMPQLAKMGELGIISNLPHDSLVYRLKEHNLFDFFKTITISYQVGHRKPHPTIYQEAMRRAEVSPENSIFVSHDQEEVDGARNVGMFGLLAMNPREALQQLEVHLHENHLY